MPRTAKGKKKAPEVEAGEAADLLNAIHQDGLDERDILRFLRVELVPCEHSKNPCRANRKDNVACFCQLVPAGNSFRKKGLWQKDQARLDNLGQDPSEIKREDVAKPVGLRNLGNTCYANAALQCLFSIPSLRNGVLNAEPKVSAHGIFRQLQNLFLEMQFGPRSSVDTEALAKTLGLDHAVQQDGQEFLKLLLTRVEQMLRMSSDSDAQGLVQRLFRGGLSYVTTCQRCRRDSESSHDVQDFYDLMPQVRGYSSLVESLAAILHADLLTGDNRYRCEFCGEKVDALRHVRLRKLPPYLSLALQRFYFNPLTADKAKALDKFSFPVQLDFGQVLEAAAAGNSTMQEATASAPGAGTVPAIAAAAAAAAAAALETPHYSTGSPSYSLVAILIHKGSQASSGHYVAHIKDQASGQWWRFDDESAECIGPNPTAAFQSDHGSTAGGEAAAVSVKGPGASRKRAAIGDPDDDPDDDREQPLIEDEKKTPKGTKGSRGKKQAVQRGRSNKRASGPGRGRGRAVAVAAADDADSDADTARAMTASIEMHNGGTAGSASGQEEEDLRRALAASLRERCSGSVDAEIADTVTESAPVDATKPNKVLCTDVGDASKATGAAVSAEGTEPANQPFQSGSGQVVSANAYMLVYRAVGFNEPPVMAEASCLPEDLREAVSTYTAAFAEQCDVYRRLRKDILEQVEARKKAVREIMVIIAPSLGPGKQDPVYQQPMQEHEHEQQRDLTGNTGVTASHPDPRANGHVAADSTLQNVRVQHSLALQGLSDPGATRTGKNTIGYWVSTAWLEQWAGDEAAPPPIDNSLVACAVHGTTTTAAAAGAAEAKSSTKVDDAACCFRLDPRKVTAAKLVSPDAWRRLQAAHGGGPALAAGDVCRECLADNFNAALLGSQADVMRTRVAAILEQTANPDQAEDDSSDSEVECMGDHSSGREGASALRYWVSKLWLQGWSKRQGASVKAEKSPTADITCPHGQLLPATTTRTARRVMVPGDIWCFLRDLWRQHHVKEAQEPQNNDSPAAATKIGRGRHMASRSKSTAAAAVDCLDLTGDGPWAATERGATIGGGDGRARRDSGMDDDGGDGIVEVVEQAAGDCHEMPSSPLSREATQDTDEVPVTSGAAVALMPRPAAPTPQELDVLCPDLQVGRVRECRECRLAAGQAAEVQAGTRRQVDAERAALGGLAAEMVPTVEMGAQYYLIPSAWVREWQQYVRPVPRRTGGVGIPNGSAGPAISAAAGGGAVVAPAVRPGPLIDAMLRVLCSCHPSEARLGVPPPRLSSKRNKLCQQDPNGDALRIIQPDDWLQLHQLYGVPVTGHCSPGPPSTVDGIRSRSRRACAAPSTSGVSQGVAAAGGKAADADGGSLRLAAALQGFTATLAPGPAVTSVNETGNLAASPLEQCDRHLRDSLPGPELRVWPPICSEALAVHSRAAKEAMLSYQQVEVMVELVPRDEIGVFRSTLQAPERKSRRSRKGRIAVTVSSTTTLEELKLQIYQHLSIHPVNQSLYVGGEGGSPRLLEGDDLTMAQHEIVPGEEIRVVRENRVDNDDDVVGVLSLPDTGRGKKRQVEEGFKNTALHGDLPIQEQLLAKEEVQSDG